MRKKLLLLVLVSFLFSCALADEIVDTAALEQLADCTVFLDDNGVDTVIRPNDQPFPGVCDTEDAELNAFVDIVEMPGEDATVMRVLIAVIVPETLEAREMTLTVGSTTYTFTVSPVVNEYDTTYYEDYIACMTDESLPMLRALARSKTGEVSVLLEGVSTFTGTVAFDPERIADLYDAYVDCGGTRQDLEGLRELWPVRIQ